MNTITASNYSSAIEAYKEAKVHPQFINESTTILCTNEEFEEIIEATSDEDVEGYANIEGGADIWGVTHTQRGDVEFRIYLKVISND